MQQTVPNILTFLALMAFALGIQTSVSIPAGLHIFGFIASAIILLGQKPRLEAVPKSFWFLALFIISWIISGVINFENLVDMKDAWGDLKYWIFGLIFTFPLSVYISNNQSRKTKFLIQCLLITVILALFVGFVKLRFGYDLAKFQFRDDIHPRLGGFYGYMRYAYNLQYLIVAMTGLIVYRHQFSDIFSKPLILLALTSGWIGLIFSQTRGALIATITGILTITFFKNKKLGLKFSAFFFILLIIGLGVVFTGGSQRIRILEKYNSLSNTVRLSQFQSAVEAFRENPLWGLGPNQFRHQVRDIKIRHYIQHQEYFGQHAHNIYLEIMANLGIIGLISFLLWIGSWIIEEYKSSSLFSKAFALPLIITCLVAGTVEYVFNSTGAFTLLLVYSLSIAIRMNSYSRTPNLSP